MSASLPRHAVDPLDSQRFGRVIARAAVAAADDVEGLLTSCREDGVEMLIARCDADAASVVHALETQGFLLMDTLMTFSAALNRHLRQLPASQVEVRPLGPGDERHVEDIARGAFHGYQGHYHADARLPRDACDAVYVSWASRLCERHGRGLQMLLAWRGHEPLGFIAAEIAADGSGRCGLYAVRPEAQGAGVGRALMSAGMRWCADQGAQTMLAGTHLTNLASQRVWTRLGFGVIRAQHTFHRWFAV